MLNLLLFFVGVFGFGLAYGAPAADEMKSMPGYDGALPSKQYSGYLDIQGDKHIHYMLVLSQGSPSKDPLTLWLNGGPGASSTGYGYFNEMGPFHCDDDSLVNMTGNVPKPYFNPLSWDRLSNMLFLEHPAGVGYSYCDDPSCRWNDHSQAEAGLASLQAFFKKFPEFKKNDFYIVGESYGGTYVPTIAYTVLTKDTSINIKGIAVGNGVTGHGHGSSNSVHFFGGHGLFPNHVYDQILKTCDFDNESNQCRSLIRNALDSTGDYYSYNIYDTCGDDQLMYSKNRYRLYDEDWNGEDPLFPRSYPCGMEKATTKWMNHPDVVKALHVKHWQDWRPESPIHYSGGDWHSYSVYPDIIGKIRVLIFNGDADPCVPYTGDESWTRDMVQKLGLGVKRSWRTWSAHHQVAGYTVEWEKDFSFATVKNSGHMVPQYKPAQAYELYRRFLAGESL